MYLSHSGAIIFILLAISILCYGIEKQIGQISAVFAVQNRRIQMKDFFVRIENESGTGFYAILDGHGGNHSAHYAKHYLTKAFIDIIRSNREQSEEGPRSELDFGKTLIDFTDEMEAHLTEAAKQNDHKSGTTCLMVIAEKNKLTVGNVGDSRGVMCDSKGKAIALSLDHKARFNSYEEIRICQANMEMIARKNKSIHGLAMTRSLGDLHYKEKAGENVIISKPEIKTFDLTVHKPKFMILASDGLWDKVGSQKAVDLIMERYLNDEDFGANALAREAILLGSGDNITVMVIVFNDGTYDVDWIRAKKWSLSNMFAKK